MSITCPQIVYFDYFEVYFVALIGEKRALHTVKNDFLLQVIYSLFTYCTAYLCNER